MVLERGVPGAWVLLFATAAASSSANNTICGMHPRICQGMWNCADDALNTSWIEINGEFEQIPCALNLRNSGLTGTIPTELGLYKHTGMNVFLYRNSLSGTVPTELSGWGLRGGSQNCMLQESQSAAWNSGTIHNTNQWACPLEATGLCVGRGRNQGSFGPLACSYEQPPSPPSPPSPPLSPPPPPSLPPPLPPPPPPSPTMPPPDSPLTASGTQTIAIVGGVAGVVVVAALGYLVTRNMRKAPKSSVLESGVELELRQSRT